ncbi:glycosyltransferase family 2 protein [Sellimonas caecigallum]|uniref:Glycosyltransferase n=1 Tax=Sellimonas caecigallum TaxID=2592333 RepID=A0ABS7L8C6_9FIRM|nr:glycosyltransferase [Sellimonas caecigallum]MBY0759330.1 glycosyltransferase [Sellimonas caecigallum]
MDLISVIVTCYNGEKYIKDCLESICRQTYKNLQIIIVDDGSQDKSWSIIQQYASKDTRITAISKKNGGVSSARNCGLKCARGKYISFIDGDDTIEPDMYEFLMQYIMRYKVSIVHCAYNRVEQDRTIPVNGTGKIYVQNREEALKCVILGEIFVGSLCNKLFNRELFNGIYFDESLKINEDILVAYYLFNKAEKSVYIDVPKYNYIIHKSSACNTESVIKKGKDTVKVAGIIYNDCLNTPMESWARERLVNMLIFQYRTTSKYSRESKKKIKNISGDIWKMYRAGTNWSQRIKINVYLLHYVPFLYKILYQVNDKLRKPNWDV